jgi:protein-tyrosine-phosphatase
MRWTGVAMVEYKRETASGRFALMEINGRFWGSLPLTLAAGMNFPGWLYQLLVDGALPRVLPYRVGIYSRNLEKDANWFTQNWRAPRDNPLLITIPRWKLLREAQHVFTGRERWDTVTLDDWRPGLKEATQLATLARARAGAKLRHRMLGLLAGSALWRKLQAVRVNALARQTPRLLFMCKGNICRSPFAEAYIRKLLGAGAKKLELISGGTSPHAGRPCPEAAVRTAGEFGLSLDRHRSRQLSRRLVTRAGAIFCMDLENYDALLASFPEARGRCFLLRTFDRTAPGTTIPDPWGESLEVFRLCYRAIADSIEGLLLVLRPVAADELADRRCPPRTEAHSSVA